MTANKKTLYEVLEVPPNASDSEIQAAHQRLSLKLQSQKTSLNREDIDFKLKVINVAFQTLSVPRIREAYDARLSSLNVPANGVSQTAVVASQSLVGAISLKADAVSLKADAVSLKADAVSLKADAMSLIVTSGPLKSEGDHQSFLDTFISAITSLGAPLKKSLIFIGSLVAVVMVMQVFSLLFFNRQVERVADETANAEEKISIQEYYQEHGVRPASKIEADLLETENRRMENERRELAREKQREEEKNRQFTEESRRIGLEVSENLRRGEERARYEEQVARQEEERKKLQLEQERREQEEAERSRIEEERIQRENEMRRLGIY